MRNYISEAIALGVESALQCRSQLFLNQPELVPPSSRQVQMDEDLISLQELHFPRPSVCSDDSLVGEGEVGEQ